MQTVLQQVSHTVWHRYFWPVTSVFLAITLAVITYLLLNPLTQCQPAPALAPETTENPNSATKSVKTATHRILPPERSRLSLPVNPGLAGILTVGAHVDIYLPINCENQRNCNGELVAKDAIVVEANFHEEGWTDSSQSSVLLDVTNLDIKSLVGVTDTQLLRYILTNGE